MSEKSATDQISSSSGSKAPAKASVDDGTSVGKEKTVPMQGGQPLPAGSKQEAASADTTAKLQAEDPQKKPKPKPKKPLPKKKQSGSEKLVRGSSVTYFKNCTNTSDFEFEKERT